MSDLETARKRSWVSQLAAGRVFELRSKSKRYPAPCALVIDDKATGWGSSRLFTSVDRHGVVGDGPYCRSHNPDIYVAGIRREQFTSARVLRRRPDLERFDADDLALIRYGLALDFSGRIRGHYSDMNIPSAVPAEWTVFWLAAWSDGDYRWLDMETREELERLLRGAWHFENYGGARRLGYKYGRAWATRHQGVRLNQIRQFLRSRLGGLIEQQVKVVRWREGANVYTEEIRRECPALGSRACLIQTPKGTNGIYR